MVLDSLGSALRATMRKIAGASHISPELVKELVRDIQRALLQADVNVKLALELSKRIESRALEEKAPAGMTAREHVVRIVHSEMVGALGVPRELKPGAQKIMLVGLYGQGKTTTAGKLAKWFQRKGLSVGLTGADVHRPAAFEQLSQLAAQLNVPVAGGSSDAVAAASAGLEAHSELEVQIYDTAGRHALDGDLIAEMKAVAKVIKPDEILLVLDATVGQQAGPQAAAFHEAVGVTGVVLTKLDSSAKGGGALSAVAATDAPVMFVGTGEMLDALERLEPDRFISRLLGMGDLQSLLERAEEVMDADKAEETAKRLLSGKFSLVEMREQMEALAQMGPLGKVMEMIPGMSAMMKGNQADVTQKKLERFKVLMNSMTQQEMENPKLIKRSRLQRIAAGAGADVQEVRELLAYYNKSRKMMSSLGGNRRMQKQLMRQMERGELNL
ncbi:MAG: signal recognition particle protein [Euryarchaeota archaeon]|jgi:signal recognition particle subunit SRP54|nr:signal recognition particle protein [Euryarchaeota archaeon]MDP6659258.1 signal recognition particle protein Srp54 [Candidatus Poseidoniia archaeon]MDP6835323.1 signal recognition particle protein Srp54 [Candidatus Poseidoniia archaeon]MDP7007261.1 signal recognition particle protein Srp54 [Candidatus Poseidoniia archaeon]